MIKREKPFHWCYFNISNNNFQRKHQNPLHHQLNNMKVDSDSLLFLLIETQRSGHFKGVGETVGGRATSLLLANSDFTPESHLDVAKWLGTVLWPMIWGRNVDTLRTNSKETFMLVSTDLKPKYTDMSTNLKIDDPIGVFGVEIIRGAIEALQLKANVSLDSNTNAVVVEFQ